MASYDNQTDPMQTKYMTIIEVVKEAIWLRGLVEDLGLHEGVTTVFCDNHSAIYLTKYQMYHERTKHIDVRYRFIREIEVIKVKKIDTADNPSDMITKPVPSRKFECCLELLVFKVVKVEPIEAREDSKNPKDT